MLHRQIEIGLKARDGKFGREIRQGDLLDHVELDASKLGYPLIPLFFGHLEQSFRGSVDGAQNADSSEVEVREAGNLCRCTGYQNIVVAALTAAKRMKKGA